MPSYTGSCHCGAVRFAFEMPQEIRSASTCDCTLCRKKHAAMINVPVADLKITQGEDMLTLYQWNTMTARHYFCKRCGIYPFHRMRTDPGRYGINVFCVDGLDFSQVEIEPYEFPGSRLSLAD